MGALVATGCSAPVVDESVDAGGGMTQGIVLIERIEGADGATQTNVSAKFMRLSAATDPEAVERVVGTRLDVPAVGECMILRPFDGSDELDLAAVGSIELLDAGDVTLRTDDAVMPLATRAFPDIGDRVSGVFYTSRDAAAELPAPAKYRIESSGSAFMDPFALESQAPSAPEEMTIADADLGERATIEEGSPATVRWQKPQQSADDLVYVDVWAAASGATVRCAFPDAGEGTIPASLLDSETLGAMPATVMVGLHRIRIGTFGAGTKTGETASIDLGEVRFDLGLVGRMTIEPAPAP